MEVTISERSRRHRLIRELIKAHDAVDEAKEALSKAHASRAEAWKKMSGDLFPHLDGFSERMIVQDGTYIYEIRFDVDDWGPPEIKRVDWYTSVLRLVD